MHKIQNDDVWKNGMNLIDNNIEKILEKNKKILHLKSMSRNFQVSNLQKMIITR